MVSIYVITNRVNGKRYVGQSIDARKRFARHRKLARQGAPGALHAAIRKHGAVNFDMRIIESCATREAANDLEIRWIRVSGSRTHEHGYNLTAGGDGGADPSAETRAKIGYAARNRSPESLAKMRRPRSDEARANMAALRRSPSDESRARMRTAQAGKVINAETRAKMSAAMKGRPKSEEHRAKMSAAAKLPSPKRDAVTAERNRTRVWTDEARAKMSSAKRNPSHETRAKMSAAQNARRAREKST